MSAPDQPVMPDGERRHVLLKRLSREMAQIQHDAFGKGPESVSSYMFDDLLLIVMRDGLTVAEKTMLGFGHADLVRNFRQHFENEMTRRLHDMVEQVTGQEVLTYQSQIMFDPDVVVEIFVFERAIEGGFVNVEIRRKTMTRRPVGVMPALRDAAQSGCVNAVRLTPPISRQTYADTQGTSPPPPDRTSARAGHSTKRPGRATAIPATSRPHARTPARPHRPLLLQPWERTERGSPLQRTYKPANA